jgi:hypothetical protein
MNTIPIEAIEQSATEWFGPYDSLMRSCFVDMVKDKNKHRDIGKLLAQAAEIHVNRWLTEKTGRPISSVTGQPWDGVTTDELPRVRNQIKFRMADWHFETTRRNSKKNEDTNSTGHVAYRNDEFDMLAIFIPSPSFGITGSMIRCIPISALINPAKPDQLVPRITSPLRKLYDSDEKTEEVLKEMYQIPLSPLN